MPDLAQRSLWIVSLGHAEARGPLPVTHARNRTHHPPRAAPENSSLRCEPDTTHATPKRLLSQKSILAENGRLSCRGLPLK